jgi:hypothetical protein
MTPPPSSSSPPPFPSPPLPSHLCLDDREKEIEIEKGTKQERRCGPSTGITGEVHGSVHANPIFTKLCQNLFILLDVWHKFVGM